jgi:hypothetical protein
MCIYAGCNKQRQEGVDIIIATPASLDEFVMDGKFS